MGSNDFEFSERLRVATRLKEAMGGLLVELESAKAVVGKHAELDSVISIVAGVSFRAVDVVLGSAGGMGDREVCGDDWALSDSCEAVGE